MPTLPPRITSAEDLITSRRAVCDGFLAQALAKTEKVTPYIDEAIEFCEQLQDVQNVHHLSDRIDLQPLLAAVAGFSEKAQSHLTDSEIASALNQVLTTIADKANDEWRDEIMYRYLLVRGESLGGSMRNITGARAGPQLAEAIVEALKPTYPSPQIKRSAKGKIQAITWRGRVILFDKKPKFIGNGVDVIMLNTSQGSHTLRERLECPDEYLACGELKGGIDPAGADEHWKTASSALERIRGKFSSEERPAIFFVGAAIETSMASEIFQQLRDGRLAFAANSTVEEQLTDLADWLVEL